MGILIKNGEVITSAERRVCDVYCSGGTIQAVGADLDRQYPADTVIEASGQLVLPGGIDAHVHMELPVMGTVSSDDFETGTAAGVAGGTTSVIDFVTPHRSQSLLEALALRKEQAQKAVCDYAFHMSITRAGPRIREEMRACVQEEGIPSFKIYMAYKDTIGIDDADIITVMEAASELGGLVTVHAENGDAVAALQRRLLAQGKVEPRYHAVSRPSPVEGEATGRAIMLARITGARIYIVHLTCREALAAVAEARACGQQVMAETCPHYLLLDDTAYDKPGFEGAAYVLSPPLRPRGHQEPLWEGLAAGLIQTVATDHCPFHLQGQKSAGRDDFTRIPSGAAGIEHRLGLLYTFGVLENRIDVHKFVDIVATRPAKIFGLYPRKGSILPGADADLVIFDPAARTGISALTHHHRCDRSIYEGFELKGRPSCVIAGGRVQFRDGRLDVQRGAGRFLRRTAAPFASAVSD